MHWTPGIQHTLDRLAICNLVAPRAILASIAYKRCQQWQPYMDLPRRGRSNYGSISKFQMNCLQTQWYLSGLDGTVDTLDHLVPRYCL